jgi:hypothetical protein
MEIKEDVTEVSNFLLYKNEINKKLLKGKEVLQ